MMLTIALATLFVTVTIAALVSLTDSAIKWRNAFRDLKAERVNGFAYAPSNDQVVVVLRPALVDRRGFSQRPAPAPLAVAA